MDLQRGGVPRPRLWSMKAATPEHGSISPIAFPCTEWLSGFLSRIRGAAWRVRWAGGGVPVRPAQKQADENLRWQGRVHRLPPYAFVDAA
jgi:hypothetical protein